MSGVRFTPFRAAHLDLMTPQAAQKDEYGVLVLSGQAVQLEGPEALSAWVEGRCIGAAGLIALRPHRALAWMLLSAEARSHMLPVVRKVRRVVRLSRFKRVEITVKADFTDGDRFARLIGAKCETPEPMRFFGADEGDERMFAWIRES